MVTLSGAVIGGPDRVIVEGGPALAVLIRDYRGNPDVLLYMDPPDMCELGDDPDDHDARAAHGLAPVFAPGAELVRLARRVPVPGHDDRFDVETHYDVSEQQLEALCRHPMTEQLAVHRPHLPIPTDLLV